jgi:penicillin-binding protein-related factor A (putative recombinase)
MFMGGWPDYLVIDGAGRHWWYEVKHMRKKGALSYERFSTQQLQMFGKMVDRNVNLEVVLDVDDHGTFFVKFSMLFYFMIHNPKLKSIPFDYIEENSVRWE